MHCLRVRSILSLKFAIWVIVFRKVAACTKQDFLLSLRAFSSYRNKERTIGANNNRKLLTCFY